MAYQLFVIRFQHTVQLISGFKCQVSENPIEIMKSFIACYTTYTSLCKNLYKQETFWPVKD